MWCKIIRQPLFVIIKYLLLVRYSSGKNIHFVHYSFLYYMLIYYNICLTDKNQNIPETVLLLMSAGYVFDSLSCSLCYSLKTLSTVTLHIPITCVTVTNSNSHILAGLSDGKLIIIGIKKNSEVK